MSNHSVSGIFITLEGGEGAGKSTVLKHLSDHYTKQGREVISLREPGGTQLGESIRHLLLDNSKNTHITARAELLLFLASRAQLIEEVIKPALAQGKVVICDRFNDSTVVYQGVARHLGMETVQKLCLFACEEREPDLTLYLDIDPEKGLKRAQKAQKDYSKTDRFESEKLDFHRAVHQGYQILAKQNPKRIKTVDASKPVEEVIKQAISYLP
jgi:dTMP kinase